MIPTYTKDGKTYVLKSYTDLGIDYPREAVCTGCAFASDRRGCSDAPGCMAPFDGQWREVGQPLTAAEHKPEHGGYPESRMPLASDPAANQRESVAKVRAAGTDMTQQERILDYLRKHGPKIKDEIVGALTLRASSVTARLNELVAAKQVNEREKVWNPATRRNVTRYEAA